MRPGLLLSVLLLAPSASILAGCSEATNYTGADAFYDTASASDGDDYPEGGDSEAPPEHEQDLLLLAPATTDAYVFVANPNRDTVTRISVPSLEVITVGVGVRPTVVKTTSDYKKAVVFNAGSDDLSIVQAESLDVTDVVVRPNLNGLELSPDGRWAVVFHDADIEDDTTDTGGGTESYNEISVVDTDTFEDHPLVVGNHPRQVAFTADSTMAVVVCESDLTVLSLGADEPTSHVVALSDDLMDPAQTEEIAIAPDGSFAFVRQFESDAIKILDLATLAVGEVPVGYNPTDLDITPDGRNAVVVSRGANQLWLLDTADPYTPPVVLDWVPEVSSDVVLGSVLMTPDGKTGILYTNSVLQDSYVTWDVASGTFTERPLVKPVQSMAISPSGHTLLVFHTRDDVDGADSSSPWYHSWAITLLSLDDFRQNPLKLAAEPMAYAQTTDGNFGFFVMDGEPYLEVLDYANLLPDDVRLKSNPEYLGTLPHSNFAYVSQEHELGRISFYDTASGELATITGFELNSDIEH
jgi:DNA-binding beta-propeller fold protein YncE